jgi:quinoprotein glucose dehydrogenase
MGVPNIGGSLTTRAGLIFIGATQERAIRAFDINTGKLLWLARLPAGGHATPMTYVSSGRQFVVIAAGGNAPLHSGVGDYVIAFALPLDRK